MGLRWSLRDITESKRAEERERLLEESQRAMQEALQAKEALQESELKYRSLVKFAPAGIYEVDFRSGRFTEVNDAMCQILGYRREELLEMTAFNIMDEAGKALFAARIRQAQSSGEPAPTAEYRVRTKDGRLIWALLNMTFHREDGKIVGATVIANDITELRQAEEKLQASNDELRRFNKAMVGREMRMVELKNEINELCRRAGLPERYGKDNGPQSIDKGGTK